MSQPALAGRPRPATRQLWSVLVVALAVLSLLALAVSGPRYLWGEVGAVEAVNAVPSWIGWPFRVVMQLGTLWVAMPVVVAVAWATRRDGTATAAALTLAVTVAFRADNVLKDVIERPRPSALLAGLHHREEIGGFGFPSGHTTMAVAIVASVHPALAPRWRPVAWALAATTAVTRMHVGVHWPADLAGGAALGVAVAAASWLVVERLPRSWFDPPAPAGDVRPSPERPSTDR